MSVVVKTAKRTICLINGLVDTVVIVVIMLLIAIGFYAIWDSKQIYVSASTTRYDKYKPSGEDGGLSLRELQEINSEVFA